MAPEFYLRKNDYALLGGGALIVLLAAYIVPNFVQDPMNIEAYTRIIVGAIILYGIFAINSAIQSWAGELARYLQLIGIGLGILMLSWIPHIGWHLRGSPAWLGMGPAFWITLFHGMTVLAFLSASYGFHLFWKKA